jgi:hypothetical protein
MTMNAVTAVFAAVLAGGCIPGGPEVGGGGTLEVSWEIKNPDGSPAPCQPGYPKMAITTDNFRDDGVEIADPQTVLFDCAAGHGTIELEEHEQYGSRYKVQWTEVDETGGTPFMVDAFSQSVGDPFLVQLVDGHASTSTTLYPTGGWMWIEWHLDSSITGNELDTCVGAGVDHLDFELTDIATNAVTKLTAKCEALDPLGTTMGGLGSFAAPLPAGEYGLVVGAFAASGEMVGMATDEVYVEAPNKLRLSADIIELSITNR